MSHSNDLPMVNAATAAQKRALSYSLTIQTLFLQILNKKMPADRILAQYFRENKKHGSKDRKVIRETLFALFRWWGWLQKVEQTQAEHTWFSQLALCALLEQHGWTDISEAWLQNAALSIDAYQQAQTTLLENTEADTLSKLAAFSQASGLDNVVAQDLLPAWFWAVSDIPDKQKQLLLVEAMSSRPPIWARAQQVSVRQLINELALVEVFATESAFFNDALNLGTNSINLNNIDSFKQGKLEIQDLASQVIGQICNPSPTDKWWDACSGAGGKTLQLTSLMHQKHPNPTGTIISSDIRRNALEELQKRAKRAGYRSITTLPWKSEELPVPANQFDGVLVDAPCSCIGTWRRNPDMRWIDDVTCVESKPDLQLDILTRSSKAVKSGGQLVYATCSLIPEENEQVVLKFLATNTDFSLHPIVNPFDSSTVEMLTIWPYQANSDGMFVAKMLKK